jgi:hypothetical protein
MLYARTGAAAIAAVMALSPIHAMAPKPIVDLSKSPAVSEKPQAAPATPAKAKPMIGPFDEQTAELGGGAIVLLAIGMGAFALSRRKRDEVEEWEPEAVVDEPHDPLFDEPMFQPAGSEASAFAWDNSPRVESQKNEGESWVERAYRGPTPDNPSHSLRARLKRAAFFDKREREAAAGEAAPVDADAGLPDAMTEEREREAA